MFGLDCTVASSPSAAEDLSTGYHPRLGLLPSDLKELDALGPSCSRRVTTLVLVALATNQGQQLATKYLIATPSACGVRQDAAFNQYSIAGAVKQLI